MTRREIVFLLRRGPAQRILVFSITILGTKKSKLATMYKTCTQCEYFSQDVSESKCPQCEASLRLTMLPPVGTAAAADQEVLAEDVPIQPKSESLELPIAVRLAQIGTGIFVFFAVSRWGTRILFFLIGSHVSLATPAQAAYVLGYTLFLYVVASLAGGAVAGAWSVNWLPQGIGVGLGVLALPLLLLLLFLPQSLPLYLIGVVITTTLTILGAFLGHKFIRPSQFVS